MVDKGDIPGTHSFAVTSIESLGLLGSTWFIDLVLVQGTETLKRIFERCEIGSIARAAAQRPRHASKEITE
ncbi:hypothetical protein AU210_001389 [Fusarium oxysporum f. sp. radicis-cucumerinum]|uniref:Uncharacterized protein n=2 Tax=Fusarium oxysporum TaxID=5507 RepID=A0A2H3HUZ0_FUSOX|nr:hypothetical protein AU210_001389 [Fusarium oxysporum f. sp. radicis-cucumerinum]RKK29275.1 hypothetical protein BFJ65_g1204 [Fusarium oxysporum f. sp. cepae]